jgi:hypothetical protein
MATLVGNLFIIPLINSNQTLTIQVGQNIYTLTVTWNYQFYGWVLDIADVNNNNLCTGIPLVTGEDLMAQFDYLALGFSLFVYDTSGPPDAAPTLDSLGVTSQVYFQLQA